MSLNEQLQQMTPTEKAVIETKLAKRLATKILVSVAVSGAMIVAALLVEKKLSENIPDAD